MALRYLQWNDRDSRNLYDRIVTKEYWDVSKLLAGGKRKFRGHKTVFHSSTLCNSAQASFNLLLFPHRSLLSGSFLQQLKELILQGNTGGIMRLFLFREINLPSQKLCHGVTDSGLTPSSLISKSSVVVLFA